MSHAVTHATSTTTIEFDCQSCASTLEVPLSYLGVRGPCPYCGGEATAPTMDAWIAGLDGGPAMELKTRRVTKKKRPPTAAPPQPQSGMLNSDPLSPDRMESHLQRIKDRFRRTRIPRIDDSGPSLPQLLGWATVALTLVATGFGLAVAFYTVPLKPPPRQIAVPLDLTVQVAMEKQHQAKLQAQAQHDALDAVAQFFHSGSNTGGQLGMYSASGKTESLEANLFPAVERDLLTASSCTRRPGTTEYLVTVEPADQRGPVFIVEQQQGKLLLHADALKQQAQDTLNAFLSTPGEASIIAYVMAQPSHTQLPITGLDTWPKLDIIPPFPCDSPHEFIASAHPESAPATAILDRVTTQHYTKMVGEFKWSKNAQGHRFVELVRIIPNAWAKF